MNKIDFPTGVQLPLTGGGLAVLYEFAWEYWWGRFIDSDTSDWIASKWNADGSHVFAYGNLDIRLPKRKAWVVWYPDTNDAKACFRKPAEIVKSAEYASLRAKELGGTYQEITEP